ncbi:MAG: ParB/RepB/Spo0J family partition protein [Phycisphaerales bacterium]
MNVSISKLIAGRQNPRRVKPEREAHRRLVASIRAHGLLEPLLVLPEGDDGRHRVIAGNRRLAALREVHRGEDQDEVKVPCITKRVDETTASAMSLAENFAREPMHPLDEAEAFSRLASDECKGVAAIAEEFGVTDTYVRQRMKLADLCGTVKAAFREGQINVGIAEAFAAVPPQRQEALWKEIGSVPNSGDQVRRYIENEWIAAAHALFNVATIDPALVSHDLFGGSVIIHRSAFIPAQQTALIAERERLADEGWSEVVVADREQVRERLYAMSEAEPEYEAATAAKLRKLRDKREKLIATEAQDEAAEERTAEELDEVDRQEREIVEATPGRFGEVTKAKGTVFLIPSPDGRVERRYCLPRKGKRSRETVAAEPEAEAPLTSDTLIARQAADYYAHHALAVREAVSKDRLVRKRLIVLALHPKVRSDGLAVSREANATTHHAHDTEGFQSAVQAEQAARFKDADPFAKLASIDEADGYKKLARLSEKELDALIAVLIVESLTGHPFRATPLLEAIGKELEVSVRSTWTPDAAFLSGYSKSQLAHLAGVLKGAAPDSVIVTSALTRKKSQLVDELAALFSQAAHAPAGIEDKELVKRANAWVPDLTSEKPSSAKAA